MATTYRPFTSIPPDPYLCPVTALSFDPISDTLWTGTNTGNVVAYHTTQCMRGVAFPVGARRAVQKIIANDSNVRASFIAGTGIGAWGKGGVNKWYYTSSESITTFSNNSSTSVFAAATVTPELLIINSQTGDVVRQSPTPTVLTHLHISHSLVLSGASDGYLRTHDPRSTMRENGATTSVQAHNCGIQGLQTLGNYVITIGLNLRQGRPYPDPLVKVFDMRTMRPLPPVAFSSGPAWLDVLPKSSSTIVVSSIEGLVNVVDISNPNSSEFYQLDTQAYLTSTAVSPTGAYLAFGDNEGTVHLMTAAETDMELPFNGFDGQPIDWADSPEPLPDISWTDTTPLNIIGMPHYSEPLLSSWNSKLVPSTPHFPPPARIPTQILTSMKFNDNVAYAALPKELRGRRNVVDTEPRKSGGRFRSGKTWRQDAEPDMPTFESNPEDIPKSYAKVEIEYSKFGVEDFDFGFYNKTDFSGLETHILNSYTNPIVQVMHYILPIRRLAKSHITTNCPREHCLLCELGFVTRMLEDARGTNCQSSNFCKTVGVLAQASNAIELVDYGRESVELSYSHVIQAFHRFLIDRVSTEGNTFPDNPVILSRPSMLPMPFSPSAAPITQLLGVDAKNVIVCSNCGATREKDNMTHIIDLIYPRRVPSNDSQNEIDFVSILRNSLLRHTTHKATCQTCKAFATFETLRSIPTRDLPPLLALNASVFNEESHKVWKDAKHQSFLNPSVEIKGQVNGVDDLESATYEVRAMVVQIVTKDKGSHLVAIVKVPEAEEESDPESSPWYLFNDFVVRNISEEEAMSFPGSWKVPSVLYLERVDIRDKLDFSTLPNNVDKSILSRDTNISLKRDKNAIRHDCLQPTEAINPGTLVAIDAEFVSMQQEETEYRSDGTKKVLRPARLSLARVSVLRGDGPREGVPFIDDHIHTSEVIVDYLTEFSGIKFGDLDPHLSHHTLTPLKVVYKKLRLLVDLGCIFIGHGLSKDFRIINIFVPPDQVIDTVDLYFLSQRQRRLSLRFLTWFVLGENIQTDTHDSIEDALSTLKLYKAYHTFESEGVFDKKLDELYKVGKQFNWKPPPLPGTESPAPPVPPSSRGSPAPLQFAMHGNLLQSTFVPPGPMATPGFATPPFARTPYVYSPETWRRG